MDGGGIRGLITVILLQRLSERPGLAGFLDRADLLAGTSTGGLIALAVASGMPLDRIRALYETKAEAIFKDSFVDDLVDLGKVRGADYSLEPLREELERLFGEAILGGLARRVLITAFDLDNEAPLESERTWKPKLFHNFPGTDTDATARVQDVALYTSAAPTYFPSADGYIDGGVFAPNPSMCALAQSPGHALRRDPGPARGGVAFAGHRPVPGARGGEDARLGVRAVGAAAVEPHAGRCVGDCRLPVPPDPARALSPPGAGVPRRGEDRHGCVAEDPGDDRVRARGGSGRDGELVEDGVDAGGCGLDEEKRSTKMTKRIPLLAAALVAVLAFPSGAWAQANVEQVDHTCGTGTGHVITYHVKATGTQPIYAVYFPRPRFQRTGRPVLNSSGFACCETCCTEWTYTETTVKGKAVSCFNTTTHPIQPGDTRTFTVVATLNQTVHADGKDWKLEGGGLTQGNQWFFSTSTDPAVKPKTGGNAVAGINGSGSEVKSSPAPGGPQGVPGADNLAPDHMICDPPEFSGVTPDCAAISYYVVDDQDPSPSVLCEELEPGKIRLTAWDSSGNTTSSVYLLGPTGGPGSAGVPLSPVATGILAAILGGLGWVALQRR